LAPEEGRAKRSSSSATRKIVLGDDAIEAIDADWFEFGPAAIVLADQLYEISESSGVCCGIIGSWGSGKSSFMRIMEENLQKSHSNLSFCWFTAWDPGGIQDLGDAMLYRLFAEVAKGNDALSEAFARLEVALGIRKSMRERASRILETVSEAVPEPARVAVKAASGLLSELDTPRGVKDSFDELVGWLESNNRRVFLFIDDIDRASGEQIRVLLSELKVYVSHRNIAVVIGYDENYVIKALGPVLPPGIDPSQFLAKIVTVRRQLPSPTEQQLRTYAATLLNKASHLDESTSAPLANFAERLSHGNPRKLKTLILDFANDTRAIPKEAYSDEKSSRSALILVAARRAGLLGDNNILESFGTGDESEIAQKLREYAKSTPEKADDANTIANLVEALSPYFNPAMMSRLRLVARTRGGVVEEEEREDRGRRSYFDWSSSLEALLSVGAKRGFSVEPSLSCGAIRVDAGAKLTRVSRLEFKKKYKGPLVGPSQLSAYELRWSRNEILIVTSAMMSDYPPRAYFGWIESIFSNAPLLVVDDDFTLWVIDDSSVLARNDVSELSSRAEEISKGLKHAFFFRYTDESGIASLLKLLLSVEAKANE
jgi:hypothetical protein